MAKKVIIVTGPIGSGKSTAIGHISKKGYPTLDLDKISDEISTTSGYEFNNQNSILATSGKSKYKFDITQDNFAWIASNKMEKKMIKTMKRGSRIMITGYNKSGSQTIDHYSLLGFTKAYNAAKKSCT